MLRLLVTLLYLIMVAADYCDSNLCCNNAKHIACGHTQEFDVGCPKDKRIEKLAQEHIDLILNTHNKLRNKIASGKLSGFKAASRMATMVGVTTLNSCFC
jgi:hypothetical protein